MIWIDYRKRYEKPVSASVAGVEKVTVRVDGLAYPFCAYNIENRVKTLPGVTRDTRVVTNIEKRIAWFTWNPQVRFSPSAVRKSIKEVGFAPHDVFVVATGTVRGATDKTLRNSLRLLDDDGKVREPITLARAKLADRRETWEALKVQMKVKKLHCLCVSRGKFKMSLRTRMRRDCCSYATLKIASTVTHLSIPRNTLSCQRDGGRDRSSGCLTASRARGCVLWPMPEDNPRARLRLAVKQPARARLAYPTLTAAK